MTRPSGVLPAAGSGTGFGSRKLMHPLSEGRPIGIAAVRNPIEAVPDCIAVLRPGDTEPITALLEPGCQIVENPKRGASSGKS